MRLQLHRPHYGRECYPPPIWQHVRGDVWRCECGQRWRLLPHVFSQAWVKISVWQKWSKL